MSKTGKGKKLWGGRFGEGERDQLMEEFNESISFDYQLWRQDLRASIVYARALMKGKIISQDECNKIVTALETIAGETERNEFTYNLSDEDIHTAHERRLKEIVGNDIGGKLHTGRSRNDQVATDCKLWLIDSCTKLFEYFEKLLTVITERAENETAILMPGYTHLQRAQPIRWSHWLLNYGFIFLQDVRRLKQVVNNAKIYCPLGSGALAGNPFNLDLDEIAKSLGFQQATPNSMFTVSDRDFVVEFLQWASLSVIHFSKLAEDLIIYSSGEFNFIRLADAYCTGSSLMPQKKNADSAELIRGKSGRIVGHLVGTLTVLKGTASTFNKDLQEDKEALFDSFKTIVNVVRIACGVIDTLTVNPDKCLSSLSSDMLATDVAYYLVRRGCPFRDAHHLAGQVIQKAEEKHCQPSQLTVADMKTISPLFGDDVSEIWNFENSTEQYIASGGTALISIQTQCRKLRNQLAEIRSQ